MDKKTKIRAIEVVRRIRDEHAAALRCKSNEEIIAFFREAAEEFKTREQGKDSPAADKRIRPSTRKARRD